MDVRKLARHLTVAAGIAGVVPIAALLGVSIPAASADCPDVEVVFARGSGEAPGVGITGESFVEALRQQIGGRSLGVYAVNYPASTDFSNPDFPRTVVDGVRDASGHIQSMASSCPKTREVLGGYSQGAAVAGYVTAAVVPPGVPANQVPAPMAPEIANHVAAVTVFGMPSDQFMNQYGAPTIVIGPLYRPKTLQLCVPGDGVCGDGSGPNLQHTLYATNGMTNEGADFAASHL